MSIRAIRARIICDQVTLGRLWRTHCIFNTKLIPVLRRFNQLKRGEDVTHPDHARAFIWGVLRQDAENAYDRIIKAANGSAKNATAKNWFEREESKLEDALSAGDAIALKKLGFTSESQARGHLENLRRYRSAFDLFVAGWLPFAELRQKLEALPKQIETKLYQEAVAIISGHDKLTQLWDVEHKKWLKEKADWESDSENQKYLAVRPLFQKFEEEVGGTIRARRERWHRYLDFLRANKQLVAWRGREQEVYDLDDAAKERVRRARPWKRSSVEAREFWERNKELKALDGLHGEYEKKFVRRGKKKRNPDGFKHRPTFTEPNPTLHPRWFSFNGPQTGPVGWDELQIPTATGTRGSVRLLLLTADNIQDKYCVERMRVDFKADPRLSDFRPTIVKSKITRGKDKGQETDKAAYSWADRQLGIPRTATIGGIKLMFTLNADDTPNAAFLVFACKIDSLALSTKAKEVKLELSDEVGKSGKRKPKGHKVPSGLVSLAVDIGIRHVGFATLARWTGAEIELLRARNIRIDSPQTGSPGLRALGAHKRDLRRRRSQRGNPIKGESSHVELQQHIDHMAEDRFKKAARKIINLALNTSGDIDKKTGEPYPPADVLIIEDLGSLKPDATFERGVNTSIATFNHGHIVDRIKELAEDVGLRVISVRSWATSQVCHRCGSLGRRYEIRKVKAEDQQRWVPVIRFGDKSPLFACPKCQAEKDTALPFTCNADFNAAFNHQRRFYFDNAAVAGFGNDKIERAERLKQIDADLEPRLRKLHKIPHVMGEMPW